MKHPVKKYEPKHTVVEALRFAATESGLNAARKFCGGNFTTQTIGKGKALRFLLRTNIGWVPIIDGDFIYKENGSLFNSGFVNFTTRWKEVKEEEENDDN